jgi:hypothetical protein
MKHPMPGDPDFWDRMAEVMLVYYREGKRAGNSPVEILGPAKRPVDQEGVQRLRRLRRRLGMTKRQFRRVARGTV